MAFQEVIGHRTIVDLLARSVARETLPPSLIFAGPSGIGKRRTAIAVAQALNCPEPKPVLSEGRAIVLDACGTCPSCTRIARGVHADVVVVEPGDTGSIRIEQVREVIDRAA